jgi:hypothetical protein
MLTGSENARAANGLWKMEAMVAQAAFLTQLLITQQAAGAWN